MTATDPPPDFFITGNKRPASFPLAAEPAPPVAEEPGLYEYTGNDLFLMTHGYPKNNPPKHIPNRRRDEDTRGFSLFREIKKYFYANSEAFYLLRTIADCFLRFETVCFTNLIDCFYSISFAIRYSLFLFAIH